MPFRIIDEPTMLDFDRVTIRHIARGKELRSSKRNILIMPLRPRESKKKWQRDLLSARLKVVTIFMLGIGDLKDRIRLFIQRPLGHLREPCPL